MSRTKLNIELDFEFSCFGISCHQKDYRLAWNLNDHLNIKLEKKEPIVLREDKFNEEMIFSKFCYFDERLNFSYSLLSNRNTWGYLIPEEFNIDYFLLVSGERFNEKEILEKLRLINIILSFGRINVNKLKSKERLLL